MAARRTQSGPATSYATVIAGASLLAAVVATACGVPGAPVVWVALMVAGWLEQAPMFTGKKDQRGFPTPAHPGEQKAMNTYRFWTDLRWRLACPTMDWLPGWPVLGSWLTALAAGALVSFAPIRPDLPGALVWANIACAFITVAQVFASRRRTAAEDDQCPGTRIDSVRAPFADKKAAISLAVAMVAVGAVTMFVIGRFTPQLVTVTGPVGALIPMSFPVLAGLAAAGGVLARPWQSAALATWRELVQVRREWAPRWQMLKSDPAPYLTGHTTVGAATVDTFDAPASVGAAFYYQQSAKITPTLGTNMRVAVLEVANADGQGQPVPGTCHPLRFDVVMWPADQIPDIAAAGTEPAVAELLIRCGMGWAADMIGFARFVLTGADLITIPESPAVWATQWATTSEIGLSYVRRNAAGSIASGVRTEVVTDHRAMGGQGLMFVGADSDPNTEYDESSGITAQSMGEVAEEDEWAARWAAVLKQNVNAPVPQFPVKSQADLADGTTIFYQPFVTLSGEDPAQFMSGLEGKLKATIPGSAPFLSIAWYSQRGTDRSGERHAQAFTVAWSNKPVPSISKLATTRNDAPKWVISGLMNEAFTAARLTRPEVLVVQAITAPTSREHIWQVTLRLYGGVTLSDVRGAATRIKVALGTSWLRVATHAEGCTIFAGGTPRKVKLARPERDTPRLVALDWEQAWLDSKVSGVAGLLPSLTDVGHLPKNDQVQVLDFDLPAGLALSDIKGAAEKLKTATGNAFVDVRTGIGGASTVRLLVCEVNPLPEHAPYDFAAVDASVGIPFATGIDGDVIAYNPRIDPHILCAGMSGGGKSVVLQSIIYGALIRGWDMYIADPTKGAADFRFAEPYAKAVTVDPFEAAAMMKVIYKEIVRRKNLNSAHAVGNYRDLPEDIRPPHMLVVIDEFTSLMGADPVPKPSDDPAMDYERDLIVATNQAKSEIGVFAGKIARESRSAGATLVLATQKLSAKLLDTIPGSGDLKVNLSRMLLGKATNGDRMSALRAPFEAPDLGDAVPPGRGLWETTEGTAKVIQGWYDPREQVLLSEELATRLTPLLESEKSDLAPFIAKIPQPEGFEEFDRTPAAPVVVELDDLEMSLDDLTLDDDTSGGALPAWAVEFAAAQSHGPGLYADPFVEVDAAAPVAPTRPAWADDSDDAQPDHADEDDEMLETFTAPPPPGIPADVAMFGGAMGDAAAELIPAGDDFGWWKIDATVAWLDAHPWVTRVVFADDELDGLDDLDTPFRDVLADVLDSRGVAHLLLAPAGNALTDDDIGSIDDFLDAGELSTGTTSDDEAVFEAILDDTFRPAGTVEEDEAAFEAMMAETFEAPEPVEAVLEVEEPAVAVVATPLPYVTVRRAALRDIPAPVAAPVTLPLLHVDPETVASSPVPAVAPVAAPTPAGRRLMTAAIPDEW